MTSIRFPERFRIYIQDPNVVGTIGVEISLPTADFQRVVLLSNWVDEDGRRQRVIVTLLPGRLYGIYTSDGKLFEAMDKVSAMAAIANWKNHGMFVSMAC